jgi:hypothetical protein
MARSAACPSTETAGAQKAPSEIGADEPNGGPPRRRGAVASGSASEIGSLATYIGFLTAGLAALAAACQGWLLRGMAGWERWTLALAGVLMIFPAVLQALAADLIPYPHLVGLALAALLLAVQWRTRPG